VRTFEEWHARHGVDSALTCTMTRSSSRSLIDPPSPFQPPPEQVPLFLCLGRAKLGNSVSSFRLTHHSPRGAPPSAGPAAR
jgi:hypothetical protein